MFRNFRAAIGASLLLTFSVIEPLAPIGVAQQQPQRERRVTSITRATPAASPTPLASPLPSPPTRVKQSSATTELRSGATTRTLAEMQARISDILRQPELAPATVGIKVTSLDTGKVLFEQNANKLLSPASNMKLYAVAAALDRLTPDYRFKTSVYSQEKPESDGTLKGDLIIYGGGDPSLSFRFNNGDYAKGINDLADRIVAAGIKRVQGDLIGDESYFSGAPYGSGWEWEDLQWWYGAEVSALSINDNFVNVSIRPASSVGAPAVVTISPADPLLTINNHVTTAARGSKRDLAIYRELASNVVEVSGAIALGDEAYSGRLAISQPALLFVYLLRSALATRGVTISGKTRALDNRSGSSLIHKGVLALASLRHGPEPVELTTLQSVPLNIIAAQTLKPSQNLYTELILRTLGTVVLPQTTSPAPVQRSDSNETAEVPISQFKNSESYGIEVVKNFLSQAGLNPTTLNLTDASGLSRNDLVTADATVQLLTYMRRHRYATAFREALPIAGVDGTLRNRMKGTAAQNNLRAKTGTLSSASSLSGYVTTASGEELVFSIMVNNYPDGVNPPSLCIDPIAVLLASFAGRS
ncbi:MAG TPA: D-alanyl-D-alanine carboxypeptidase/D-alanyl-D-alanine-endopeptidase [Pyrinomonadaceae bacterium]|nr:D-alanyl-D-alanine carboxypeptidase/D-alanyl-D-alanine-endopeptidase [Pyrinomonadaceae bacterium]